MNVTEYNEVEVHKASQCFIYRALTFFRVDVIASVQHTRKHKKIQTWTAIWSYIMYVLSNCILGQSYFLMLPKPMDTALMDQIDNGNRM
jgi:hypothetical protein